MEAVDDVSTDDHLGGGEVFEGVVLAGVGGVDPAFNEIPWQDVGFLGLDGGRRGALEPGDGGVGGWRYLPQDEGAADSGCERACPSLITGVGGEPSSTVARKLP
ncbi:hypothetical protein ACFV30_30875 [Streptomyces sp. NPDC059752]|uniref:hypothetical protein n=1 Tax=unclassified Streptomyces TaxID=2593676 RepID=UPI003668845F